MKAIVMNAYGGPDVLELKEVDKREVSENDVLVDFHAASLNLDNEITRSGKAGEPDRLFAGRRYLQRGQYG
jgi:NADPH:quinone reductase-like Zn-dependent oxidoreductase